METTDIEQKSTKITKPETTYYTGILFHGARKPFIFKPDYHSDASDEADGSSTLGAGLYLVDNALDEKYYSQIRQPGKTPPPYVYTAYAPDVKFLDFRDSNMKNTPVPKDMLQKWSAFYKKYYEDGYLKLTESNIPNTIKEIIIESNEEYFNYLEQISIYDDIDLREMLASCYPQKGRKNAIPTKGDPNTPWSEAFSHFVKEELDYDGVIYYELSEGNNPRSHASFVIFNLDKVHFSEKPLNKEALSGETKQDDNFANNSTLGN